VRTAVIVAVGTVSSAAVRQQRITTVRLVSMNSDSSAYTVLKVYSDTHSHTHTHIYI
jgi:hypothetical protein